MAILRILVLSVCLMPVLVGCTAYWRTLLEGPAVTTVQPPGLVEEDTATSPTAGLLPEPERAVDLQAREAAPTTHRVRPTPSPQPRPTPSPQPAQPRRLPPREVPPGAQLPPTLLTLEETTSTFGLDADDVSWRRSLALARAGLILTPEDVRVEEWLNALPWAYAAPPASQVFGLEYLVTPDPLDSESVLVLLGLTTTAPADLPSARNVTVVLDASGSMGEEDKVATARQLVQSVLSQLGPADQVALAQFSEVELGEYTVLPTAPSDPALARSLDRFRPNSGTNAFAGLRAGYRLALQARAANPDALHYILFISDGVANVGDTRPESMLQSLGAERQRANPIRVASVGVGLHTFNDALMEQISNEGDGWYRYVNTPEQAQGLFAAAAFPNLFTPAADEARVQVSWQAEQVQEWRLLGYRNRAAAHETFTDDTADFAEVHQGQETTVVYRVALHPDGEEALGALQLRWHHPRSGEAQSAEWTLGRESTPWEQVPPPRRLALLVALAGENAAEPLADAQTRRERLREELAALGSVARSAAGQEFREILAASLPPPPAWFEKGQATRQETD